MQIVKKSKIFTYVPVPEDIRRMFSSGRIWSHPWITFYHWWLWLTITIRTEPTIRGLFQFCDKTKYYLTLSGKTNSHILYIIFKLKQHFKMLDLISRSKFNYDVRPQPQMAFSNKGRWLNISADLQFILKYLKTYCYTTIVFE